MDSIQTFKKRKDYLIGIDSDGCAMDTMNCKHIHCFGPCMVTQWELERWQEAILARWNEINLYTMTRGINRFRGLALALREIDEEYCCIEDLDSLVSWVETASELSNISAEKVAKETGSVCLAKALAWSKAVNRCVSQLPESLKVPFDGVLEALKAAHQKADVAVISSANPEAVVQEWSSHGLLAHVDIVLTQDVGSKAYCIGEMLKKGYEPDHVLMVGDAPGDRQAARVNGVLYEPILVRREEASWKRFLEEGLNRFLNGTYEGAYQEERIREFEDNLK